MTFSFECDKFSHSRILAFSLIGISSLGTLGCGVMWISVGKNLSSTTTTVEQIYVGGNFTSYNGTSEPYIARLTANGSLDTTFAPVGTGLNGGGGGVNSLKFDSSGKIIIGGCFLNYNATFDRSVARLNTDGSVDPTFLPTGLGLNNCGDGLSMDSSGKVIVGGSFGYYNLTTLADVARLNTDGSLDTTFTYTGTGLNGGVNATIINSSGKIIVAGAFTSYNGTSVPYVARLNTDGSLDMSFAPTGTGLNNTVNVAAIDSSGRIIVGGAFTSYNGTSEPYIARLNTNGSLDNTFAPTGTGFNSQVQVLAIDSIGKIIVGGNFTTYNGFSQPFVARLNTDGSLDATFVTTGAGLTGFAVYGLAVDSSGKIIVGGDFAHYNGIPEPGIAKLNTDGSLDATFAATGTGFSSWPSVIAIKYVQE